MGWNDAMMRSFEYGDPARALEIRGEDCTNCKHLAKWKLNGVAMTMCDNMKAPAKKRQNAPERRCHLWRHKDQPK